MFLICDKCLDSSKHVEVAEMDYGVCERCNASGDVHTVTTRDHDSDEQRAWYDTSDELK